MMKPLTGKCCIDDNLAAAIRSVNKYVIIWPNQTVYYVLQPALPMGASSGNSRQPYIHTVHQAIYTDGTLGHEACTCT